MTSVDLNFTGVKAPSFDPIPEGTYKLKLVGIKIKNGTDASSYDVGANCTYDVTEQEDGGSDFVGKKVFNWQTLAGGDSDPGYVKLWLEALTGQEIDGDFTFDSDQLIGLEVYAAVGIKDDNRDATKQVNFIKYFQK
jgi:hypothetical protein